MEVYSLTIEELEDNLDACKASVLTALVNEELLDLEKAKDWSENHTVLIRRKSFFRTITDKWLNEPKNDMIKMIVVKKV